MTEKYMAIFQNMPVFGGLDDETLDYLLETSKTMILPVGDYLFHENDKGDALYIIESGKVAIVKQWENQKYILAYLGPGDCVGEMELIDIAPRTASAIVLEEAQVIWFPRKSIFALYGKNLEQFTTIQMNMGREVSRRLRETDQKLFREYVKNQRFKTLAAEFKIKKPRL